jgi:general secretion pathway protein H
MSTRASTAGVHGARRSAIAARMRCSAIAGHVRCSAMTALGRARRHAHAHGFTLVEILVVIVILAVAAGAAVTALGPDDARAARREARRAAAAIEYAAERAMRRAETLGIDAAGRELRFWRRNDDADTWTLVTGDDVLAARALPAPLTIVPLAYAGRALATHTLVPLRPSGRNEPARFAVRAPDVTLVVTLDPLNRTRVTEAAPAP